MSRMTVPDALRVASIFEADDVISVPAMACRIMARYIKELEEKLGDGTSIEDSEFRPKRKMDPPLQE